MNDELNDSDEQGDGRRCVTHFLEVSREVQDG